jgi:hypothetical protein
VEYIRNGGQRRWKRSQRCPPGTILITFSRSSASLHRARNRNSLLCHQSGRANTSYVRDPDTSDELRKHNQEQLDKMRQQFKRVDDFIANFKPLPYWFCPQFLSPGRIFKDLIPRLFDMYRQFSGSTHSSFIGSVLAGCAQHRSARESSPNPQCDRCIVAPFTGHFVR